MIYHVTVTYVVSCEAEDEDEAREHAIRETVESSMLTPEVFIETDDEIRGKR